jgi:hypothetical protein
MLRTKLKAAIFATTVAAAVIAPAAAASAASTTVKDGAGDVWENTYDAATDGDVWTPTESAYNTDVVSTVIKHNLNRVSIKMTYNDLQKQPDVSISALVNMRFDQGARRFAFVDASPGSWGGSSQVFKNNAKTGPAPVACGGLTHAVDYVANTVTMSIPRTCLGSPRWIEANVLSRSTGDLDADVQRNLFDNGQSAGHGAGGWSARLRRG